MLLSIRVSNLTKKGKLTAMRSTILLYWGNADVEELKMSVQLSRASGLASMIFRSRWLAVKILVICAFLHKDKIAPQFCVVNLLTNGKQRL